MSVDDAAQLSSQQLQDIASEALMADPEIVDSISKFYAQHPRLLTSLGSKPMVIILEEIIGS